jgi:hypothetical protein
MKQQSDLFDAVLLWAAAAIATILAGGAVSLAATAPWPLAVSLYFVAILTFIVSILYTTAGAASIVVGVRQIVGDRNG